MEDQLEDQLGEDQLEGGPTWEETKEGTRLMDEWMEGRQRVVKTHVALKTMRRRKNKKKKTHSTWERTEDE